MSRIVAGVATAGVAIPGVVVVGGVVLLSIGCEYLIREITRKLIIFYVKNVGGRFFICYSLN